MKHKALKLIVPFITLFTVACTFTIDFGPKTSSESSSTSESESSSSDSSSSSSESSSESSSSSSSSSEISSSESESSSSEDGSSIDENPGYVKATMNMLSQDLQSTYAPALGDVKMLVVPISFAGNTADGYSSSMVRWTSYKLEQVNNYYFGETNSLASYYKTASFDKMRITGKVADVYQNTTYSVESILSSSINLLYDLLEDALNWIHDNDTSINWSEYDLNRDGCVDNIHFITDYHSTEWGDNLWPHMYWTDRHGTLERPMANVYSLSGTYYVNDPITAIHEQGHIFGLDDYYDYSDDGTSPIDYVGHLDMQSYNVFDWNSYSKLTTGWVEPYVIDGTKDSVTITLEAASLNGDCLLIPANYETWNGSAFDEYILLEYFAPYGNNYKDWQTYRASLGSGGVRLYHVDARVYGSNKRIPWNPNLLQVDDLESQQINCKEDISKYLYNVRGANNSSDWVDYEGGIEQLADHPLLTVVQRSNNFTFAKKDYANHTLTATDLFKKGHEFTFEKYSHFMNKSDVAQSTMDNGEVFPYTIKISKMTETTVTVIVTKA